MDPTYSNPAQNAADILRALDQRFFDHNRVQSARLAYHKLEMGSMAYNDFRIKFTQLANIGKINTNRWFEDLCEKVSPALKNDIRLEKYNMGNNYNTLDELLAVADREARNIKAEELARRPHTATSSSDSRGILKMSNWRAPSPSRAPSPTPVSRSDRQVAFGGTTTYPRASSPTPKTTANSPCNNCGKMGHWANDCSEKRSQQSLEKKIAEMVIDKETDELSENF